MGKISQGILGGFSGKVGSVVGANWKGINYMRSKAVSVANPRTEGQVKQRTKFSVTLNFLQPITDFLRVGYKMYAIKKTAFNAAMSYFINNAITGESPDFSIDPSKDLNEDKVDPNDVPVEKTEETIDGCDQVVTETRKRITSRNPASSKATSTLMTSLAVKTALW